MAPAIHFQPRLAPFHQHHHLHPVGISIAVAVWQTLSFAVDRSRQVVKWWHYGKFKGGIGQKTCCCLVCLFINVIISVRVAVSKMLESPPRHEEEISLSKLTIIPGVSIYLWRGCSQETPTCKHNCVAIVLNLHASFPSIGDSKIDADLGLCGSFGDLSTTFLPLNWIVDGSLCSFVVIIILYLSLIIG